MICLPMFFALPVESVSHMQGDDRDGTTPRSRIFSQSPFYVREQFSVTGCPGLFVSVQENVSRIWELG